MGKKRPLARSPKKKPARTAPRRAKKRTASRSKSPATDAQRATATSDQLAKLWDCTTRQVELLAKDGIAVRVGHGKYDPVASTTKYIRHLREQAAGRVGLNPQADAVAASASMRQAQRDLMLRKLDVMEGKLVNVDQVKERIAVFIRANRQFVIGLANQLTFELALSPHDHRTVKRICRDGLRDAGGGLGVFAPVIAPVDDTGQPDDVSD